MKSSTFKALLTTSILSNFVLAVPTLMDPAKAAEYEALKARQFPAPLVLGPGIIVEIFANAGSVVAADIANAMATAFNPLGAKEPWADNANCLIKWTTQGGTNCYAKTSPAKSSGNSSSSANTHSRFNVCAWENPASTAPPIQYWTDPGIGEYSIQMTATDKVAWADGSIQPGGVSKKCPAQGLCHPQLRFYRENYNLVINTWLASTDQADGVSDTYDGLCQAADVQNQFSKGGDVLGSSCAIPCWNQAVLPDGIVS